MSFSSELKEFLNGIKEKRHCCRDAFSAGLNGREPIFACEKDAACFIRGVFSGRGFVTPPGKNKELVIVPRENFFGLVKTTLEEAGFFPKSGSRGGKKVLYFKDSGGIEDLLCFIGASKYALIYMEKNVISEMRGTANRLRNAETANLDRSAKAAAEQCGAIKFLIKRREFEKLSAELKECARLRIENPDMCLGELRALMPRPISKSGLNHRLKKIIEIAGSLSV